MSALPTKRNQYGDWSLHTSIANKFEWFLNLKIVFSTDPKYYQLMDHDFRSWVS